jgi:hypothetical protein
MPQNPNCIFRAFYDKLDERGYVNPSKLMVADGVRIGLHWPDGPAGAGLLAPWRRKWPQCTLAR